MHEIIIRFPDEKTMKEFCGQMCDGAGEGICDFTPNRQKPNTTGKLNSDYERLTDEQGRGIYFVNRMFTF
jgi:hypothetical protein